MKQMPLFATWSVLMAASVSFAMQSADVTIASGSGIAKLTRRQGTVQFRQEGVTLWLDAGSRQSFRDGTLLATGAKSKAQVAFQDGREIELGESSQVILTLGSANDDSIVTLLKGTLETKKAVVAANVEKAPQRLIIKSGNKRIALATKEDSVSVAKVVGTAAPVIATLGGVPAVAAQKMMKAPAPILPVTRLAVAAPEIEVAPPTPTGRPMDAEGSEDEGVAEAEEEEVEEEEVEEEVAEAEEPDVEPSFAPLAVSVPRIVSPTAGVRLWTTKSLTGANAAPLLVALQADKDLPIQDVNATVQLTRGKQNVGQLKIIRSGNQYAAKLNPATVTTSGTRDGSLPAWTMSLRARVAPKEGEEARLTPIDGKSQELTLASLADFPKGGASLYVATFAPRLGQGWIAQTGAASAGDAAAGIHLTNAAEMPLMAPLMRGSGAFTVASNGSPTTGATQIVRGGKLVARVQPDTGGAATWVRKALSADLAFKGPMDALIGTGADVAKVKEEAKGWQTAAQLTAYNMRIEPATLHAQLFKKQDRAWDVLAQHARVVFSKPVEMVDPPAARAPDINQESESLRQAFAGTAGLAKTLGVPGRLIFVEGMEDGGEPRFRRVDHNQFNELGIVTAANANQSAFALNLNPQIKNKLAALDRSSPAGMVEGAMIVAEAEAVVLCPDGDTWIIAVSAGGKLKQLASAAPPEAPESAAALHTWVLETLGINNRILMTRGRAAMTLTPVGVKEGMQGVVVSNDGVARSIVELSEVTNRLGVVKLLAGGNPAAALPAGARILWE